MARQPAGYLGHLAPEERLGGKRGLGDGGRAAMSSATKGSRARRRMYVRWCIPRGLFGKGCSRSGLPPSRILIFRERLMNRLCGLSCWLA